MSSSRMSCSKCGSSELESDTARGDIVCTQCGSVVQDNLIISEIQFQEGTRGSSQIIGQTVSTESGFHGLSMSGITSSGKESREMTLYKARRQIRSVGAQLCLNNYCIDMAYNFYKMALNRRFTYGRKHNNVIAACVYITCRIEGTSHMLLDLSDIMQINVYELGKTYLRLSTTLCINIPLLDPCIYIVRFAHRLDLGEKTHDVEMTALRLVQRMKRDWIHHGRRPSGLCGAALLVATRLNSIQCTIKDVVDIVKVCETTIRKRLNEFGDTPTSKLTLEEFMNVDLEGEEDPPCYKAANRRIKMIGEDKMEEVEKEINNLQKQIDEKLKSVRKKFRIPYCSLNVKQKVENNEEVVIDNVIDKSNFDVIKQIVGKDDAEADSFFQQIRALRPTAASLGIKSDTSLNVTFQSRRQKLNLLKNEDDEDEEIEEDDDDDENDNVDDDSDKEKKGELNLDGIDDEEIDMYILSKKETLIKTKLWYKVNKDYLKELKEKEKRKAEEEAERKLKESRGELPVKKKRKTKKKQTIEASTAGEAIEKMLEEKKLSNKINYDILRNLT